MTKGGRHCTVCTSPHIAEINAALTRDESFYAIARRYNLGWTSVQRHAKNHLARMLIQAVRAEEAEAEREAEQARAEARAAILARTSPVEVMTDTVVAPPSGVEVLRADGLLNQMHRLLNDSQDLLDMAKIEGKMETTLKAVETVSKRIELLVKLRTELRTEMANDITQNPQWVHFRTKLMRIVRPYPEIATAVAAALVDE